MYGYYPGHKKFHEENFFKGGSVEIRAKVEKAFIKTFSSMEEVSRNGNYMEIGLICK